MRVYPDQKPAGLCLDDVYPGDPSMKPLAAIQEFFRAIMMRTNFVPVVRHVIGWRGLQHVPGQEESWTAKIRGRDGVYGVAFAGADLVHGWIQGRFSLYYFPHPYEELVERCSLRAAVVTQEEGYMSRVREFTSWPEAAGLFRIADLTVSLDARKQGVGLGVEGSSVLRCISGPGVVARRDGHEVTLIEPGGVDSDFPAFETALEFFNVLASSITFNLVQCPVFLDERQSAGQETFADAFGLTTRPVEDIHERALTLGYGQGDFIDLLGPLEGSGNVHAWWSGNPIPEVWRQCPWWSTDRLRAPSPVDRKTLGLDGRPPLIILTGFLGSGKTSFLRHFIEYQTQRSRFVAVVQNEIGSVGLDGKLLDYAVTEIDEGCVCCSLAGSLKRAVHGILADFDPDCIIVETTGLANPMNLLDEMEELEDLVRHDCTLTVVDAVNAEATLAEHHLATEQIRAADIVMLNKQDLVDQERLDAVVRLVRERNPHAPVFTTTNGELHPALVLDAETHPTASSCELGRGLQHVSHIHEGLWSKSVRLHRPLQRETFLETVNLLPASVFRAKGVIEFEGSPQALLFQYVGGRYEISLFPSPSDSDRFLTLIGKGGDPHAASEAILNICGYAS